MSTTEQPIDQSAESSQGFVHGIDPMKNEIALLCAHVSVKVQCGHAQDHQFYLPYKLTQHESTIICPICRNDVSPCGDNFDFQEVRRLEAMLGKLLLLLPPTTKDKIRIVLKG